MVSDRLTKGAVSREGLHEIMDVRMLIREEFHHWSSKHTTEHVAEDMAYVRHCWYLHAREEPSIALSRLCSQRTRAEMSAPAGFAPMEGGPPTLCPNQVGTRRTARSIPSPAASTQRGPLRTPRSMPGSRATWGPRATPRVKRRTNPWTV